jgi:hypothetical protein
MGLQHHKVLEAPQLSPAYLCWRGPEYVWERFSHVATENGNKHPL